MTFAYREMQHADLKGIFRLEFTAHSHTHRTVNKMLIFAMGKQCQKI